MTEYTNEYLVELIRNASRESERKQYLAELYQQNYPYIKKICKRFSGHEEVDDLMQESFFGLRLAVDKYDLDEQTPFINYAAIWIEQVIQRYIQNSGNVIRLPAHIHAKIVRYLKVSKAFMQENGREPSDQELIELMSLKNDAQLKRIKDNANILKSLSIDKTIISDDGSETFADLIPDPSDRYEEIDDQIDADRMRCEVWEAVSTLDDKKAEIIRMRFKDNKTMKEIGDFFGNSSEAIRQLQNNALRKLARSEKIKEYAYDYISAKAFSGISLQSFRNTGMSATERAAINDYDRDIRNQVGKTEHVLADMKKKIKAQLMMDMCN